LVNTAIKFSSTGVLPLYLGYEVFGRIEHPMCLLTTDVAASRFLVMSQCTLLTKVVLASVTNHIIIIKSVQHQITFRISTSVGIVRIVFKHFHVYTYVSTVAKLITQQILHCTDPENIFSCIFLNILPLWRRVLLEKLIVTQLLKKFPAIMEPEG
jgi:hypothetical protein